MQDETSAEQLAGAIRTAAAAGAWEEVTNLLDERYVDLMGLDFAAGAARIAEVMPPEIAASNLWVNVGASVAYEMTRNYPLQHAYLENVATFQNGDALAALANKPHYASAQASLAICSMLKDYHAGAYSTALQAGNECFAHLGSGEFRGRSGVLCMLGMTHFAQGNVVAAHDCWRKGANTAMLAGWTYSLCLDQYGCAMANFARNRLTDAEEVCRRIFAISNQGDAPILSSSYAHLLLARIHYDRNELDAAAHELETASQVATTEGEHIFYLDEETARAHLDCTAGNASGASVRANECMARFARVRHHEGLEGARAMMASIWCHAGRPHMASDCLDTYWDFNPNTPVSAAEADVMIQTGLYGQDFRNVWRPAPLLEYARMRIREGQMEGIDRWLDHVRADAGARGQARLVLEATVLEALCAFAQGNTEAALGALTESLVLAEDEHCVRVYADEGAGMEELLEVAFRHRLHSRFLAEVRDVMRAERTGHGTAEDATLRFTRRETDIMRLLVEGRTNAEIAKRLYLGLSTVKNYTHAIYTKLGVRNRAEAIARIHDRNLLG